MQLRMCLAGSLILISPAALEAQDDRRGIDVSAFIGLAGNPVGGAIESAMRRSGFDDDGEIVDQEFPWSSDYGEFPWMIRGAYEVRHPWQVAVVIGDAPLGHTNGRRDTGVYSAEGPSIEYGASSVAVEVRYPLATALSIGAGPALHRTRASCTQECSSDAESAVSFGGVMDATLAVRIFRRLRVGAIAQYRLVGSTDVGPWTTETGSIQQTSADFDHTFVGVGAAITF